MGVGGTGKTKTGVSIVGEGATCRLTQRNTFGGKKKNLTGNSEFPIFTDADTECVPPVETAHMI